MVTFSSEEKVTEFTLFLNLKITLIKKSFHLAPIIYLMDGVSSNSSK